jgi:hypothetical protein
MLVLGAREQIDQRAQHREDRGLPTAFFFGKALRAFANLPRDAVVGGELDAGRREAGDDHRNRVQENAAAPVQRLDRKLPPARSEHQRRIDKAHVPARVPAGKLEARRKEDAALVVERVGERIVSRAVLALADLSRDADAAVGVVALEHVDPL